ncbi:MAG: hypothetical protein PHR28_08120 [candidate division Zixibacteria bacterium]|nr:hypothetical protein [candidate division Zixibacteria bacterium]
MTRLFVSTLLAALLAVGSATVSAQTRRESKPRTPPPQTGAWQPTMLIDCPTAGTLKRGSFIVGVRAYPNGGVLASTDIGMSNRLMIGVSYGAEGIVSERKPVWNPRVEFDLRLSLIDEGLVFPAITTGFSSQGYGGYLDDTKRYAFKSKGFFVVGSKNYPLYNWQVGLHGGLNYSTEQEDDDTNLDFFVGVDTKLNRDVGLVFEYDFATNDNRSSTDVGRGHGYLNVALQWLYSDNLVMDLILKNLVNNRKGVSDIWRELRVTYVQHF